MGLNVLAILIGTSRKFRCHVAYSQAKYLRKRLALF